MTPLYVALGLYLLATVALALFQRRMIYKPTRGTAAEVAQWAAGNLLEPWSSPDGRNIGWKRPSKTQPAQGCTLITHGNGRCAAHRSYYADAFHQVAPLDVYVVEYPGYGDRAGTPGEKSFFAAAGEALRLLPSGSPVYLVGESLGTGVAAYLAGAHPEKIAGVLLIAPFDKLSSLGQHRMPIFPARWLMWDPFASEEHLRRYHGPVAFWIAPQDEIVPARFGRRLFDGYAGPKRLWEFPDRNHNSLPDQPLEVWKEVVNFWRAT